MLRSNDMWAVIVNVLELMTMICSCMHEIASQNQSSGSMLENRLRMRRCWLFSDLSESELSCYVCTCKFPLLMPLWRWCRHTRVTPPSNTMSTIMAKRITVKGNKSSLVEYENFPFIHSLPRTAFLLLRVSKSKHHPLFLIIIISLWLLLSTHFIRLYTSSSAISRPSLLYVVSANTSTFGSIFSLASDLWSCVSDESEWVLSGVWHRTIGTGFVSRCMKLKRERRIERQYEREDFIFNHLSIKGPRKIENHTWNTRASRVVDQCCAGHAVFLLFIDSRQRLLIDSLCSLLPYSSLPTVVSAESE